MVLPIIIKTDVAGTGEAVEHELGKLPTYEQLEVRVLAMRGVGAISESDIKMLAGSRRRASWWALTLRSSRPRASWPSARA
jgi:translation initiation factor IF-2